MTTETTADRDNDTSGELADARRLLNAAAKLVEHLIEDGDDAQEHILGVIYAVGEKIDAASKMPEQQEAPNPAPSVARQRHSGARWQTSRGLGRQGDAGEGMNLIEVG